jgi:hypothetical protein
MRTVFALPITVMKMGAAPMLPEARSIAAAAAANDASAQIQAAMVFKDRVFSAKAVLRAHRRAYWSYCGPRQDEPLSPDGAQAVFAEQVQLAIEEYIAAMRPAAPVHH